jgi:hypothetical protein
VFRYALRPHAGDADAAVLTAEAHDFARFELQH